VSGAGLTYDRQWAVIDSKGKVITQKRKKMIGQIQAIVDIEQDTLRLISHVIARPCGGRLEEISLRISQSGTPRDHLWVNGRRWKDEGDHAAEWLSRQVECSCRLVRIVGEAHEKQSSTLQCRADHAIPSFANAGAGLLIVNTASVEALNTRLLQARRPGFPVSSSRFRPNMVLAGGRAFAEDSWSTLNIEDGVKLRVERPCERCELVCIPQNEENWTHSSRPDCGADRVQAVKHAPARERLSSTEPLATLGKFRRAREGGGRILFGVIASLDPSPRSAALRVRVGQRVDALPYMSTIQV